MSDLATPAPDRVSVVLVARKGILRDIVVSALVNDRWIALDREVESRAELEQALAGVRPDVIVWMLDREDPPMAWMLEDEEPPPAHADAGDPRPRVRLLTIRDDGRQTYVWASLGGLSPQGLVARVRDGARRRVSAQGS
jgi:hypothetical protein